MEKKSDNGQIIKTVYAGTVVRAAPVRRGGEILKIDWSSKKIINRRSVMPTNPATDEDANPRGNSRGCRGIAVIGDQVVYANYHTITVADKDLTTNRTYTHPLFVGLHEIWAESLDCLWIAATSVDGAHALNLRTGMVERSIWPRMNANIRKRLGVEKPTLDINEDQRLMFLKGNSEKQKSHLHLNVVAPMGNRLLALLNRYGVLCDIENGEVLVRDDRMIGAHNIVPISGTLCAICDTKRAAILYIDIEAGSIIDIIDLRTYPMVRELGGLEDEEIKHTGLPANMNSQTIARLLFTRGMAILKNRIFVGLSPATILEIDMCTREIVSYITLTHDPRICIHGLALA